MKSFDPVTATARLVNSLGADTLERSRQFSAGTDLLQVASPAIWILVALLAIRFRLLERIVAATKRWPRWLSHLVALVGFFLVCGLLRLPWTVIADWGHQQAFGLSHQTLADFLVQASLEILLDAGVIAVVVLALFALIRRVGRRWWISAGGIVAIAVAVLLVLGPILLAPIYNRMEPLPRGPVRVAVEEIAVRAGLRPEQVVMFDGSRQSKAFNARVGGVGPMARMLISDNALAGSSLDEVRVVSAHEAGHFALGHTWRNALVLPLLAILLFFLLDRTYAPAARLMRSEARLGEPASLPVFAALCAVLGLVVMPLNNAINQHDETAADLYALETTHLPDALAAALLRSAGYRDPRPSRAVELLFYSHPAMQRRILTVMEWKAQHLSQAAERLPPAS